MVAVLAAVGAQDATAQDSHYWSQRFGTSSRLLGGVVIGNVKDLSAGFYNPGALALNDGARFILSARVFQMQLLTIKNAGPTGDTRRSWSIEPAPSFFAGTISRDETRKNEFGYIYLARQDFSARLGDEVVFERDVLLDKAGIETVAGSVLFDENLSEYWGGVMWAREIRENFGIGGTLFVAYRGQRLRSEIITQALTDSGEVAQAKNLKTFDYYNWRTLLKFGAMYRGDRFTLGASLTTPSLNLFGQGSSFVDIARSRLDTVQAGGLDDFLAADVQQDRKSQYPTSWAVGAGGSYRRGASELTVAAEWFAPVDEFQIIDTTPFQAQSTGQPLPNNVTAEYKSVLNFGVGAQHRFTEHVAIYGAFTTDFSAAVPESTNSAIMTWDLYHFTFGGEFSVRNIHFTTGLEWAFGSETIDGLDLTDIDGIGGLQNAGSSDVRYDKIVLILGIQFGGEGG